MYAEKTENLMATEERLIDLEIKIARQDDLVETLNTQVYRQQKKIDELETLCVALVNRMRDFSASASERNAITDEKPPHY
jgi:SlyX protein